MVYKKYIKKHGKEYGPYFYKSERIDGRIKTSYVKRNNFDELKSPWILGSIIVVLLLAGIMLLMGFNNNEEKVSVQTGKVSQDIEGKQFFSFINATAIKKTFANLINPLLRIFEKEEVKLGPPSDTQGFAIVKEVTGCGVSLGSNTYYYLDRDISATESYCLMITGANTILNCQGHKISVPVVGIDFSSATHNNVIIKNCVINQNGNAAAFTGIRTGGTTSNLHIIGNTINVYDAPNIARDPPSSGIHLRPTSNQNYIENNTINLLGKFNNGVRINSGNNHIIRGNKIISSQANNNGIYFAVTSDGNVIESNEISGTGYTKELYLVSSPQNYNYLINQQIRSYYLGGKLNFENTQFGKIEFLDAITAGGGENLNDELSINDNSAFIKTGSIFDKNAEVTIRGIPSYSDPKIFSDLDTRTECSAPSCSVISPLSNGEITFKVSGAGNYSIDRIRNMFVSITSPLNDMKYNSSRVSLNFITYNNPPPAECKIEYADGRYSVITCNAQQDIDVNQGENIWKVWATDTPEGYSRLVDSAFSQVKFFVDSVRPSLSVESSVDKVNAKANVKATANDDNGIKEVNFVLYGNALANSIITKKNVPDIDSDYNAQFLLNTQGIYYLNISAIDTYGNTNDALPIELVYDLDAPSLTINEAKLEENNVIINFLAGDGVGIRKTNVTLYDSSKANAVLSREISYLDLKSVEEEINLAGFSDANYILNITIEDAGGNIASQEIEVVRGSPPIISFTTNTPDDFSIINGNLDVEVNLNTDSLTDILVELYNTNNLLIDDIDILDKSAGIYNAEFINLNDGQYRYEVTASNTAGTSRLSRNIFIDNTPPNVAFGAPISERNLTSLNINANLNAQDARNVQSAKIDLLKLTNPGWVVANSSLFAFGPLITDINLVLNYRQNNLIQNIINAFGVEGAYNLTIEVNDSAGNVAHLSKEFYVDYVPSIGFVTPPTPNEGQKLNDLTSISFALSLSDSLTPLNQLSYNVCLVKLSSPEELIGCQQFVQGTFNELKRGAYKLNASVSDFSNNYNYIERRFSISPAVSAEFVDPTPLNEEIIKGDNIPVSVFASHPVLNKISIYLSNAAGQIAQKDGAFTSDTGTLTNEFNVQDGIYFIRATAFSADGNSMPVSQRRIIVDNYPPELISSPYMVRRENSAMMILNVSDAVSGLKEEETQAEITYPNEEPIEITPRFVDNENNKAVIIDLRDDAPSGEYDINYILIDNGGNEVNINYAFDLYGQINLLGRITDAEGNSRIDNYTFYRPSTETILYNFMNSEYDLQEEEIHQREYDIKVDVDKHSIKFYNFAFTPDMNNGKIPIDIDNFTAQIASGYKVLSVIAVDTTFTGNAALVFSYEPNDLSETAVIEDSLTIFKCSDWDYTGRICNYVFYPINGNDGTRISESFIGRNLIDNKIEVNTTGFSAFILAAKTCGNGNYQLAYGEEEACPNDVNTQILSDPGQPQPPQGGGGGGGGGYVPPKPIENKTQVLKAGELEFILPVINFVLNEGENATATLKLINKGELPQEVLISISSELEKVLSIEKKIIVPGSKNISVPILINGKEKGVYIGNLVLLKSNLNKSIDAKIIVKSKEDKLVELKTSLGKDKLSSRNTLDFKVNAYNLGQDKNYEVAFSYDILDSRNESILHSEESFVLEYQLSYSKSLTLPSDIVNGRYNLIVHANYGDKSASNSLSFEVTGKSSAFFSNISTYLPLIITLIVVLFITIILVYYFRFLRRKLFEVKIRELRKKSIYPFPDFYKLPKTRHAYIGQVADSGIKTYLDYTQLNMHTLIAGGTGSGKTIAGMVITEELLKKGLSVIAFDPTGQWTGFAKKCEDRTMLSKYRKFGLTETTKYPTNIIEITKENIELDIVPMLKTKGLKVLKLDKLTPTQMDKFIENSLEKIYRARLSETSSFKSLLVLDEVHRLLPKYGGRDAHIKLEQAVREFRKWGIGLLLISQVLTDFKGAIRGNIGTEIQMSTKYEGDIKRVKERHGSEISKLISKMPIGLGMIESAQYNQGKPYFVEFRPIMHSPFKLKDEELEKLYGIKLTKPSSSLSLKSGGFFVPKASELAKLQASQKQAQQKMQGAKQTQQPTGEKLSFIERLKNSWRERRERAKKEREAREKLEQEKIRMREIERGKEERKIKYEQEKKAEEQVKLRRVEALKKAREERQRRLGEAQRQEQEKAQREKEKKIQKQEEKKIEEKPKEEKSSFFTSLFSRKDKEQEKEEKKETKEEVKKETKKEPKEKEEPTYKSPFENKLS